MNVDLTKTLETSRSLLDTLEEHSDELSQVVGSTTYDLWDALTDFVSGLEKPKQ